MEYKKQILVSWKKKLLSALLENVLDGIVMERKRVGSSWAWKK